jgi:hypothetical protein
MKAWLIIRMGGYIEVTALDRDNMNDRVIRWRLKIAPTI